MIGESSIFLPIWRTRTILLRGPGTPGRRWSSPCRPAPRARRWYRDQRSANQDNQQSYPMEETMKRSLFLSLALVAILALASCKAQTPAVATEPSGGGEIPDLGGRTITVAVENAYPPFNNLDEATGEGVGWDYDTLREICTRLNCIPEFKEAAWDGIFPAMEAGEDDMLPDGG